LPWLLPARAQHRCRPPTPHQAGVETAAWYFSARLPP
jgi:hypothetical protein